jgi:signal transduction histidine kinase
MSSKTSRSPSVVVSCDPGADDELVDGVLRELGARRHLPEGPGLQPEGLLEGDEVDLAVTDPQHAGEFLQRLLGALDGRPAGGDELPVIVLASTDALGDLADPIARRPHVALLTRPIDRLALASAVRSGLAIRAAQRRSRDLLERLRRANAELDRRRQEAEAEARRRTWLLAAISHNLRTPVNEMVLVCQFLHAAESGLIGQDDWRRLTTGLLRSSGQLREMVEDLLDIARFDLGSLPVSEGRVPLAPLLEKALAPFRPDAAAKGLSLITSVVPPGLAIRTDAGKLERVLHQLASNAVRFTDAGHVRISASADPRTGPVLAVEDTGCGIPPDQIDGVFDEFAQLLNPARDRTRGTGLGLAICRRFVSAMGGELTVASTPGRGSTFTLTLPPAALVGRDGDPPEED